MCEMLLLFAGLEYWVDFRSSPNHSTSWRIVYGLWIARASDAAASTPISVFRRSRDRTDRFSARPTAAALKVGVFVLPLGPRGQR